MKLQSTLHWEGEVSYNPEATFNLFSSLLLYGVEAIRKGIFGFVNRIFEIVGDDWIITEWEIIDKDNLYQILFERFDEGDWIPHVTEKVWVNRGNFIVAFQTAEMLIYHQIFPGKLPAGWTPPKAWPFNRP